MRCTCSSWPIMDKIVAGGGGDIKWDYALPLTGMVTLRFAGPPPEDWRYYAPPQHNLIYSRAPLEERQAAVSVMIGKMREEIGRIKNEPVEGGLTTFLHDAEVMGRKFRLDEIESVIRILLGGGLDTTQALFGMAAVYLANNPDKRQQLIDELELIENAIEEFLRVFPPTQGNSRHATADVTVAGQLVKAEEHVFMSYAAANRDPVDYENPHDVDFCRENIRHLSFGIGPHRCIGSHLARLEARIMLETPLRKVPDYKLVGDGVRLADDIGTIAGFEQIRITV